jgi:hypothetical protein
MSKLCVGMFGTCGTSTFRRDIFIPKFEAAGVQYFNPQVENWTSDLAAVEAEELREDSIILMPITDETYAEGSLAECGLSAIQALKFNDRRHIIFLISPVVSDELKKDASRAKASERSRALIREHLKQLPYRNIFLVDTLEQMAELAIACYDSQLLLEEAERKWNPYLPSKL